MYRFTHSFLWHTVWYCISLLLGLMITASHNPADDNGIKIGYADGRVLDQGILVEIGECINNDESY